jgi:hypothetical protein
MKSTKKSLQLLDVSSQAMLVLAYFFCFNFSCFFPFSIVKYLNEKTCKNSPSSKAHFFPS